MAKIIYLGFNQRPPDDQDWVLVERQRSGTIHDQTCIMVGSDAVILNQGSFATLSDALAYAQTHADKHSMASIYAKGVPHA